MTAGPAYRFDHVGLVVKDLRTAVEALTALGYDSFTPPVEDARQQVRIVFATRGESLSPRLELVEPAGDASVVRDLLVRNGSTPYHVCYRADDLERAMTHLSDHGFRQLTEAAASPAFGGLPFVFMYHLALGLVELVGER